MCIVAVTGKRLHSLSQADTCSEICSPVHVIIFPALDLFREAV